MIKKITMGLLLSILAASSAQAEGHKKVCELADKETGYAAEWIFNGDFAVYPTRNAAKQIDTLIERDGDNFNYKNHVIARSDWGCDVGKSLSKSAAPLVAEDPLKARNWELEQAAFKRIEMIEQLYFFLCHEKGDSRFCGNWRDDKFLYPAGRDRSEWIGLKANKK